ncbi:MAG: triose-phosphate isomerase [Legionella sp.]
MRQKWVIGNWKMNGTRAMTSQLLNDLIDSLPNPPCHVAVLPPAIYLSLAQDKLAKTSLKWGGQNIYPQDSGAFTGELSPIMMSDFGCSLVLVGHSERRQLFFEQEKFVAEKFHQVKDHGMIPILCIGETLEQHEQKLTYDVLRNQLLSVTQNRPDCFENVIIAYEPIWAIGTGKTPNPESIQDIHRYLRSLLVSKDKNNADNVPIIYGGSVNEKNAGSLFKMPDIDGALVGGASLNSTKFVEIVKCIN